ncbi:Biotin/lipoate A/B protein ligase [Trichormus variabilis ATCC 29413]|uniref:Biotin/lipoate A/B protein ligase n=3 Tax=Anabaena variabilis TaxID=264691 RepID=Q3M4Y8_TRIV2|nr:MULTISPECIES: biotin/lipoate A/B protein ligase family protein [Nostocaceae]ABA23948.1 Biotin/lipoate A/B protein ligase [Trichormus variabilis ATCC 29413]MBC1258127.1 lipoate--protein ligase family protein [Trichormus variabilis V5]MBC1269631.1 lipoate--protein ligase family protein [Trichormus variabilis FSR]MBC1303149.1 lipoate--protein ligase family protein [Trichormus variabilis N2B]MBC1311500.1 lipoate--protein ligase family protein [Trichormus variabilis PNB]
MASKQVWRLIPLLAASGSVQMAIDRWLLTQHQSGKHPSTIRFYTWSPPAISLGYHQRQYPEHWQNLIWQNQKLDLVRRPTGGRAVLHQGDLTYAVVTSGLGDNRLVAYQKICEFLIQGWRSLGFELSYGTAGRGYIHNPNCFGTATGADLVLPTGSKLIGSAQLRRGDVILQHGSIRLQPDTKLFAQVFGVEDFNPIKFNLSVDDIISALITAANNCFNIQLETQPLSPSEWDEIRENFD